jgi:hypothetical protein
VLVVDCRPLWTRGAIAKLVLAALLVPVAIGFLTRVAGASGSLLAFVGMLWLSPWLVLTEGRRLSRTAWTGYEVLRHRWRRRVAARRLRGAEVVPGSLGTVAGRCVHVRGRVLEGPGFVSASGRQNCVLACYAGLVGSRENREGQAEVHAVAACLLLVGEDIVEVALARARYLERRLRVVARPGLDEQTIAVGDEVDVVGNLVRTIDQDVGGYRTPGLKLLMGGDDGRPLVLCRCSRPDPQRRRRSHSWAS